MDSDDAIWAAGGGACEWYEWIAPNELDEVFYDCIMSGVIAPSDED